LKPENPYYEIILKEYQDFKELFKETHGNNQGELPERRPFDYEIPLIKGKQP
jgi:hypothetical protein